MENRDEPKSRREQAKDERRARIVNAACELLREFELDSVSVTMIAERADVSAATIYNLFGTKAAVLLKVYDRDLETYQQHVADANSTDTLATIFDAVGIAADFYRRDPAFYREAMVVRAPTEAESELLTVVRGSRQAFWENLVGAAIDDGFLAPDTDARRLGLLLAHIMMGSLADWVAGLISLDRLESNTRYGFAVALMTFATPKAQKLVKAEMQAATKKTKSKTPAR